ncbi:MAG: hypothetical protein LUF27_00050 [Lachnospiraceae bacterium]|nr:hypothetical protein [Lachnospiraceae bacterium]
MKNIILQIDGVSIPAVLNDTVAARDFEKRIPFKITCHKSDMDYYGSTAIGFYNPLETQSGWKNGDISLADGWLALLYGG